MKKFKLDFMLAKTRTMAVYGAVVRPPTNVGTQPGSFAHPGEQFKS